MTKSLARAACLLFGLATMPAAAAPETFFMNQYGGLNTCSRATTDLEVEQCAGELPAGSPADPSRFDCSKAEVDTEYRYCGKPYPTRRH